MKGWSDWGLQTRLLSAFALLSVVTAAAVAGFGYVQARTTILQSAQDKAVIEVTNRIEQLYPLPTLTPTRAELEQLAGHVSGRGDSAVAESGGQSAGGLDPALVSTELHTRVRTGIVAWQRIVYAGHPGLVIGTQLLVKDSSAPGGTRASGIEVYVVRSLEPEAVNIADLARSAWFTGGGALVLAMLLALLAARSVLRPVQELRRAAHRLGEGELATRLEVRGSDELAGVARTFNTTAESLQRHVGELERMEADARRFVADVSHELRTPLTAMIAVTDLLDAEAAALPGPAGQAARLVSQETHNLTRLVNDLIEVTRFDAGSAALALDDVDVAEAVGATLRARGWAAEVATELPSGVRARLDPRRLDVIVANLVGNALRHGAPPVTVRLSAEPDQLTIEVTDAGPGLDPDVLPHVFDRFYKADTARSRSEGSGLGLAIAWENAKLHGGTLTAANRPEGGAAFTVRLPHDSGGA
ncbi:HAMP domain-containing sensor histidine kinase [Amycolatopsis sp. NBC_01480]|uniref:HAMP domain-containing sensor histidine kinase n=1 Tax=Amycolatopsis sp. NBC_01480 TaxID=2903562 RepID=UPI002E2CAF23|nr:HAMP domain-containing sensor histidine kinase [Amycolatopsis sp. NBC_01480]